MPRQPISPSILPAAERQCRSKLHQLLNQAEGFLHGSLIVMTRRCGKPSCRCAADDNARHQSLYLGQTLEGKTTMIYIPPHRARHRQIAPKPARKHSCENAIPSNIPGCGHRSKHFQASELTAQQRFRNRCGPCLPLARLRIRRHSTCGYKPRDGPRPIRSL